jgi:NDP-4-keto-2,6-dideoxyhexose 3-C-methyltransferase
MTCAIQPRSHCRVCAGGLDTVLSLGEQYVSDFPLPHEPDGILAPLVLCRCRQCSLIQLEHTVPSERLYRNYWYQSGTNATMRRALADITHKAEVLIQLQPGDTVLDIGANDGTLLASYSTRDVFKVGFDPAENLAPLGTQVADEMVVDFFSAAAFRDRPSLRDRRPKIVTSIAMFYDLEDPNSFVRDIKAVMHEEGLWIIQMSYLPTMLRQNAFDNICHEHLEYYSLHSLQHLLERHDFEIVDVELNDVNGGSFRVYVRNCGAQDRNFADPSYRLLAKSRLDTLASEEHQMRLSEPMALQSFAARVERIKSLIVPYVADQVGSGKTVYVYGASTKGNTLLQYFGLDRRLITAAAERNPGKWGRQTVGTRIPIISEDEARAARPDAFLVLPWHFLQEFREREHAWWESGGRFIVPLPEFTLI